MNNAIRGAPLTRVLRLLGRISHERAVTGAERELTFTFEEVNSDFGISYETFQTICKAIGADEAWAIGFALTRFAKLVFPELDLDEPKLTEAEVKALFERFAEERQAQANPQAAEKLAALLRGMEGADGEAHSSHSGGHH
ncbi:MULTISPECIES: hypothetical protein [Burkholderia cepacia complex]|uniref:hypothetical protein n=1 Tax=Burkholderia cepacia complex TaxID=87882 RepID=UPI000A739BFA|nr:MULTISPECIES: hypothetical protein [Burkholderia cepacia complex]MBR8189206.1 hypothetical protein [Burkholderia vietnamiensis]HDR9174413.1 hypothetical protein [Burkholderia vietnamiensis]